MEITSRKVQKQRDLIKDQISTIHMVAYSVSIGFHLKHI